MALVPCHLGLSPRQDLRGIQEACTDLVDTIHMEIIEDLDLQDIMVAIHILILAMIEISGCMNHMEVQTITVHILITTD